VGAAAGWHNFTEWHTGEAIAAVAEDDDTLVVFGGRPDIQYAAGLSSPYRHLWSVPMRTLDPELAELRAVVAGEDPPTWIVEWVRFETWNDEAGALLRRDVEERYVKHGVGCDDRPVYLLRSVQRAPLEPDCR
jgi:hypothetical protein